jgi:hypothetical protein
MAKHLLTASDAAQYRAKRRGILVPVAADAPYGYEDAAISPAAPTGRVPALRSPAWTPSIVRSAPPAG